MVATISSGGVAPFRQAAGEIWQITAGRPDHPSREDKLTMALRQLRLDDPLVEHGLERWYATAVLGEVALIEIPRSGCVVELRRLRGARVLWHVQRGRSLTMPFAEALQRLAMLRPSPPRCRPACSENPPPGIVPTA